MCEFAANRRPGRGIAGLTDSLVSALLNLRIYPRHHKQVRGPLADLVRILDEHCTDIDSEAVELHFSEDFVIAEGRPQAGLSATAKGLLDTTAACHSGGLRFTRGLDADEAERFVATFSQLRTDSHDEACRALESAGVRHVTLLCSQVRADLDGIGETPDADGTCGRRELLADDRLAAPFRLYRSLFVCLQECAVEVSSGRALSWSSARSNIEAILGQLHSRPGELLQASLYEQYDSYTFGHSVRVALLAANFAQHFVAEHADLVRIGVAALLHDIGKVRLPYDLLHFRGRLDAEQWREMERHTELGAEMLLSSRDYEPLAVAAALDHHRGGPRSYPRTAFAATLSATTRLVKVCDVYEALTAPRPYKAPMSPLAAFRTMLEMGDTLDRRLLRRFIAHNGVFPCGSEVVLDDDSRAVVERQTDDLRRPVVKRIGSDAPADDERRLLDLRKAGRRVARLLPRNAYANAGLPG